VADVVVFEILIPRTDGRTGLVHGADELDDWVLETASQFGGITALDVGMQGAWYDPALAGPDGLPDHANWYRIGVAPADEPRLRHHLRETCRRFGHKSLYVERRGEADLVHAEG
jgi:hypothetical protein